MNSHFITGTGTGVGKTVLAAALVAAARAAGHDVLPMKPVQTGATRQGGAWQAPDLDFCLRLSGLEINATTYRDLAPYCFEPHCSPHLAAREAGTAISLKRILEAFERLTQGHDAVIVEGAGGILVPIDATTTMLDLVVELGLPVLVAASPRLGTLNHTLLTLQAIRAADLGVAGVVLVETEGGPRGAIEEDNAATIEAMGDTRVLGTIPHFPGLESAETVPADLLRAGAALVARLQT